MIDFHRPLRAESNERSNSSSRSQSPSRNRGGKKKSKKTKAIPKQQKSQKSKKKVEKNKWRNLTDLVKREYPGFDVVSATKNKSEVILLLKEEEFKITSKKFPYIEKVLKRMEWDNIFKGHELNVGLKAA